MSPEKDATITSYEDATTNFERYFVLLNNIVSYPDTSLLKKFINNTGTRTELNKFSRNLGFKLIEDLQIEMSVLSKNIAFIKIHYPQFFENKGERIKEIAKTTFKNGKQFYNLSFKIKSPYKLVNGTNQVRANNRGQLRGCCPCTTDYNLAMDNAFWQAAIQTEACAAVALATSWGAGLPGLICMGATTAQYYVNTYYAMAAWEGCVTNGSGFPIPE